MSKLHKLIKNILSCCVSHQRHDSEELLFGSHVCKGYSDKNTPSWQLTHQIEKRNTLFIALFSCSSTAILSHCHVSVILDNFRSLTAAKILLLFLKSQRIASAGSIKPVSGGKSCLQRVCFVLKCCSKLPFLDKAVWLYK